MRRRLPAVALALGFVLALLAATPALAAGYRYWSFWDGAAGGQWSYATQGPSMARPADGAVQGFRFAVSKDAADQAAQPRAAADFEAVCGATAPVAGRKRVALVIDHGVPQDAPSGDAPPQESPRTACAQVPPEATAAEALASVAKPLRYNSAALLCAISGYPKLGCGDQVTAPDPNAEPKPGAEPAAESGGKPAAEDGGPSAGLLAGIAALAALAAAAAWQSRRRTR
ncbi:SCO2322 family protein [Streptomyces sp. NBC_01408]|uniref:SCO2322 family protein n=1 Tax=Streptomyces sp. NBC_01408 TaxID=2903855 RepID=UPI0022519D51|nr:SCO2322 family protein [Streptomyces sp. NBC_01408]MCX4693564.1 SCO2322 family protein [Streptomyces sp. NBC_01408]